MCHAHLSRVLYNMHAWGDYRIVGNFHWCKTSQKCIQTLQRKFSWFLFLRKCVTLWPHPYSYYHVPHGNRRNDTERQSEEASMYNNALVFFFLWSPLQLWKHQDCHRGRETGLLDPALLILTSTTPELLLWVCWPFVQYQADSSQQRPFK